MMDKPFKWAKEMIAVINGAQIERRYVGEHLNSVAQYGMWHVPQSSQQTYLNELAREYYGWEYREVPKNRVVFRCMFRSGLSNWWRDYDTHQQTEVEQFKITYAGREPGKIKSIEPM